MKIPALGALALFASIIGNDLVLKTSAAVVSTSTIALSHPMPPNPEPYQVTSLDGTIVTPWMRIIVRGEITSSPEIYEETLDGFTVKPVKGGMYTYLDVDDATGELIETDLVVGKDDPGVESQLRKDAAKTSRDIKEKMKKKQLSPRLNEQEGKNDTGTRRLRRGNVELGHRRRTAITSGTLKNLVIPFKFSDHTSRSLPSQAQLNTLMNNVGPDPSVCPTGSVRDVYLTNSFAQLDVQSTVIDWVTLDSTYTEAYCADGASGLGGSFEVCLVNALNKAVAAGVDFGTFDLDNNGIMDGMTFFHSGYAAEFGGIDAYGTSKDGRIWSHKSSINQNWSNNGVQVGEYHINPSLWSTSGSNIGRIGVIAHETGHFLGLPDLYDYGDGVGIGSYGLMGNCWGFDGSQYYPPLMSAWSKKELGWVTPQNIRNSGSYSLNQACDNADMIMINVGYPTGEYLLIENRQACGTELRLGQGGLAIWHIDENANNILGYNGQTGWPTNGNHYKIALLQADGSFDLERNSNGGDNDDLFHSGGVHAIGPNGISSGEQHPNTKAYQNGKIFDTHVAISNISAAGATMTFDISIDEFTVPPSISPAPTNSCRDENDSCAVWASNGECSNNPAYMLTYCKQSCNSCSAPPSSSPTIAPTNSCRDENDSCAVWASNGECSNNPAYMLTYCKQSCNSCSAPPSSSPTVAPKTSTPPSSSPTVAPKLPSCPSNTVLGNTLYFFVNPYCVKAQVYPTGVLTLDTGNADCTAGNESQQTQTISTYSRYDMETGSVRYDGVWSGDFYFNLDASQVNGPTVTPIIVDDAAKLFDISINYSTCPSVNPIFQLGFDSCAGS